MSNDKILYHPAFANTPVQNPKKRGRRKGTICLADRRRQNERLVRVTQVSAQLAKTPVERIMEALAVLDFNRRLDVALYAEMLVARYPRTNED